MEHIMIVGAGYSGVLTAKKLAKAFRKDETISVTIIDKNPYHTMLTELHEVAAGRVDEESIKMSLRKIFAGRKVTIKQDTVTSIDFETKTVSGIGEDYSYDYLVISAGSKPTYFGVSGADQFAHKLWSYEDAVSLKEHIHTCFRKACMETDEEEKRKLLTFYVVGAGFTGVEMIGELAEYVPVLCEKYEIDRNLVTLCNVDVLERAVPNLPEKLSAKVEKRLKKMGVDVLLGTSVVAVGEDFIEFNKNGALERIPAETVIWAAGIEGCDITERAAKQLESAGRGRLKVDPYLRAEGHKDVFVVGDNLFYIPVGEEAPVPQTVENCEHSAKTAAHNLICEVGGIEDLEEYQPKFHGLMVCIGGRYGVARAGTAKHMISWASFFAMFIKHFVNIIYYIKVLGYNKVISYLKHEFFTVRNCRSFVGGHFSNRTPSFLMVPLRIWLGAVWVYEGIMKIVEGWFQKPMLTDFFGGAASWFDTILNGGAAADAVSSATAAGGGEAAVSAGTAIFNIDVLGLFSATLVSGKEVAESALNDFALRLDVPLIDWFLDKTVLSHDTMQLVMQIIIVLVEILIGLALMGGLFTTLSAAVSLVLQFMFLSTTGLYLGTFWMVFAGIAVLIGAGRSFGLDYYAMPYLKKKWKKVRWVKKSYLYHD